MKNSASAILRIAAAFCVFGMLSAAHAAPPSAEDHYIATRDAAIKKIAKLYNAKKNDEGEKAEKAASAELLVQLKAILTEPDRKGFGPAELNLDALSDGDQGFGLLDGLRYDSLTGENGEKAGRHNADKYVEPKTHIIVTTPTLLERWLRSHKDWWGKDTRNVAQQIGAAFRQEDFYTQAISSDASVVKFSELPITAPASATSVAAMLGGRTQDSTPDPDMVFVSAVANGRAYVAYQRVKTIKIAACETLKADYNKKAEKAAADYEAKRIDKKTYDKLPHYGDQGDAAFKKCLTERLPQQPSFAEATKHAQALLAEVTAK